MRGLTFVVALACLAAHAHAQLAEPLLPPGPEAKTKDMLRFCSQRSNREGKIYPRDMVLRGRSGLVVMDCLVNEEGRPTSCAILSETPRGNGFDDAALKLACRMQLDLTALGEADAQFIAAQGVYRTDAGWRMRRTVPFRVED